MDGNYNVFSFEFGSRFSRNVSHELRVRKKGKQCSKNVKLDIALDSINIYKI